MSHRSLPLLLLLALVFISCGGTATVASDPFVRVGAGQFAELVDQAPDEGWTIIDLRTNEEMAAGFIEGAIQVDFYGAGFADELEALPKDGHYLIYCNSGNRSATALRMMKDLGFEQVTELDGGIQAWMASELPVVIP